MPTITTQDIVRHKILSKQRNLSVSNTTSETDLWTYTIPPNTLKQTNSIKVRLIGYILFNTANVSETITFKWYYGSTLIFHDALPAITTKSATIYYPLDFDVVLAADNATNVQVFTGRMHVGQNTPAPAVGHGDIHTPEQTTLAAINGIASSEDSTVSKILKLTTILSSASTSLSVVITYAYAELISY